MTTEREHEGGKRERSSVAVIMVVLLVVVPLLYLLSTGPVIWLESRGYMSKEAGIALGYIYAPIRYIIQNSDSCMKLFKLWFYLWEP
jgi:hypothetical protein